MSRGEYLYIPTDGTQRKGWGERSGARQMLDARNRAIRQAFRLSLIHISEPTRRS